MRRLSIMIWVCCLLILFGVTGCVQMKKVEGGGTTDNSDPHAPKTIVSTELTRFYAAFLSKNAVDAQLAPVGKCVLEMRAEADSALVMVACEDMGISLHFTVDKAALNDLQALIQEHDLAAINGHSKRNTALGTYLDLTVEYASGERIHAYAEGGASTAPPGHWNPAAFAAFFQRLSESNGYGFYPVDRLLLWDIPLLVMVDGKVYRHEDYELRDGFDFSDIRGEITGRIPTGQIPEKDGQSNFGYVGAACAYVDALDCLAVQMDGKWMAFEPYEDVHTD